MKATGEFEVQLKPLENYGEGTDGITLGRMSIDKTFKGQMDGKSVGEMLSARTPVPESAGYVAIEQFTGSIDGKSGTCVFQHFGIMSPNNKRLTIEVVPDSGTGELVGLSGTLHIDIDDGTHTYDFTGSLESS